MLHKNFQLVFKSNPNLSDSIKTCKLDLANNQISFEAKENENCDWINWLVELPDEESLTCFFLEKTQDGKEKTKCVLLLEGLYIEYHDYDFSESRHMIDLSFVSVTRMHSSGPNGNTVRAGNQPILVCDLDMKPMFQNPG